MAGRRPSPPRYPYGNRAYPYPERTSTGTFYPPSTSVNPYAGKSKYTSPRTSGERISKGPTTLAAIESYDRYGRKISSTAPAYDPRLSSSAIGGTASRRLSLNTSRVPERYPPDVTYAPQSGPRAPERYDRGASHQTPVSSTGLRGGHNRHSASIDDAYRIRGADERSREPSYDPPRKRRESLDQSESRADRRGYHRHAPRRLEPDERTSHEYGSSKDRLVNAGLARRDRSDSLDAAYSERPKNLAIEYPGYKPPPSASRGLDRINGVSRAESLRNRARSPPRPADRDRADSGSDGESYQVARRPRPQSEYYDRSAMLSPTRQKFEEPSRQPRRSQDPDIGNRGFGLRVPSPANRDAGFDRSGVIPAGMISLRESRDDVPQDDDYRRPAPRPRQTSPEYDRDPKQSRERGLDRLRDPPGARERDTNGGRDDRAPHESRAADRVPLNEAEGHPVDRQHDQARSREKPSARTETVVATGGGLAALAAGQYASRRHDDSGDSDEGRTEARRQPREKASSRRELPSLYQHENIPLPSRDKEESPTGERHPLKELENGVPEGQAPATNAAEDDYQRRLQREYERVAAQAKPVAAQAIAAKQPQQPNEPERRRERSPSEDYSPPREMVRGKRSEVPRDGPRDESPPDPDAAQAITSYRRPEVEEDDHFLNEEYSEEPSEMPTSPTLPQKRVAIVDPPKDERKPKGILKTRSVPFPDYPEEPKEGARPHKTAKVEGAPEDATLTKLPRSVYSTEILDEYSERYTTYNHEITGAKMICILRVVDKETLKKYEQKSKDLREGRHKDHRRHKDRGSKDKDKEDEDDDSRRHRKHRHRSSRSKREDDVGDEEDNNSDYDDDENKA